MNALELVGLTLFLQITTEHGVFAMAASNGSGQEHDRNPPRLPCTSLPDENDLHAVALYPPGFFVQVFEVTSDGLPAFAYDGFWRLGPWITVDGLLAMRTDAIEEPQQLIQLARNPPTCESKSHVNVDE